MGESGIKIAGFTREGQSLDGMVEVQAGAVVSRTVIDKNAGTVTLFAFDKGQGLSEHTAPFDALVCLVSGNAEITIDGRRYRVSAGEMILLPAGKPHSLRAPEPFKMMLVMIRGE